MAMTIRTALRALSTLALAPALLCQALPGPPSGGRSPGAQASKRLFLDSVVASINDSAILQSKLFLTSAGTIEGALRSGRPLTVNDVRGITIRELRNLITEYQMAMSARSFGNFPPERFDMILKGEIEREMQARANSLGTTLAVSEELARTGETWQTFEEGLRVEKLQMLANEFAINARLRKQSNLFLTPRMLRETFEEVKGEMTKERAAVVAMVAFSGPEAANNAKAASEFWRTGDWDVGQVASRYANATKLIPLPASSLPAKLKEFALAGPLGNVSEPMAGNRGTLRVAKIMQYTEAYTPSFEDPAVQAQIREIARNKVFFEFRKHAHQRARDRTEVWIYEQGRRKQFPIR